MATATPAAAQLRCRLPEPTVRLDVSRQQPSLHTAPLAELQTMAREGLGEHERILGLYKAEFRAVLRTQFAMRDDGKSGCVGLREVVIDVQIADRRIYLARELARGTCRYDTTLAHEQRHARIDDAILARELPILREALARAATDNGAVGPVPIGDLAAHRDDIGERMQRAMRQELSRIDEIRRSGQGAIDTPESYRREAARCPGE